MPRAQRRRTTGQPWRLVALLALLSCFAVYGWSWLVRDDPTGSAVLLIPILGAFTVPFLVRAARSETRFDLAGIAATGLALRFGFAYYRWEHGADAHVYQKVGATLAESFRALQFDVDTGAPVPGTGGLRYINGLVSVITGSGHFTNFLLFAWIAFWGCVLLYRAFALALPDADHRRYALFIFLWPSLMFWPSSVGKEAWMVFTLGVAMLGAARIFRRRPGGYVFLTLGLLAGSFVRPHVALLALLAVAIGLFVARRVSVPRGQISVGLIAKIFGLLLVVAIGGLLVSRTQELLDVNDTSGSSFVEQGLEQVGVQTAQGGSEFDPANPRSPAGYVEAAVTIVLRPFPFEADTSEQVVTSIESLVLLLLLVTSWRRLWGIVGRLRDHAYFTMAIAYVLMFVFAFGTVANFGILARQRVQLLPFVFALLAAPAVAAGARIRTRRRPVTGGL